MTESTQFGQAPTTQFGQAPANQFGQAPTNQFGQAPAAQFDQAPAAQFGQAPAAQFGQAPAAQFGQAPAAQQTPVFGSPAPANAGTYVEVSAVELGWITQEEAAVFAQYENSYQAMLGMENRYPLSISGTVTFSALAAPFLPKEDRKNNGRLWELKVSLKNIQLHGDASPFAKYAFAKRLRRNPEGEVTYQHVAEIPGSSPEISREQACQLAMNMRTKANKVVPMWPIPFVDINDNSKEMFLSGKDFATDGSQQLILVLNLARTGNQASVAKYMWYKPYLQGVMADFNDLHFNEYQGGVFRNAQKHALEMARQAQQNEAGYEQAPDPAFGQQAPANFGQQAPANFGQQAPDANFGQQAPANFGQQAPANFGQQAPANFGQQAPAPANFGQQAPANFGQQAPAPANFGQQAPDANFGQQAPAPSNTPFAQPFDNGGSGNPFA